MRRQPTRGTPAILILLVLATVACSSPTPNRDPLGDPFPAVEGESLDGRQLRIPQDLPEGKVLLLIGYVQNSQFDIDRWLLGLIQAKADLPVYELPTIEGIFPGLVAGTIDEGMRKGIPREDWASVVTVYGDAGRIVELTGNENPNNARVVLLDAERRVAWFHDRGYSARSLLALLRRAGVSPDAVPAASGEAG
jgi:hypothetical protein